MASAELGDLYAADVMTLVERHEMCIRAWLCAREVLRLQLEFASAERGRFLRAICVPWMQEPPPCVASYYCCLHGRTLLVVPELRGCCQLTLFTDGRGELLSAGFVAEG